MLTPPPVRERIPIWIAALRDRVLQLSLEVADGLMLHALWSPGYTFDMAASIDASLQKYGRKRQDIEINAWPWVAINNDRRQALDDSRPTVAAYAGIKAYESFFEARGFLAEAKICQQAEQNHGDVRSILHLRFRMRWWKPLSRAAASMRCWSTWNRTGRRRTRCVP